MADGQRIVITGSSGTIGGAVARALGEAGSRIVLHCNRGKDRAEALRGELARCGAKAHVIATDLSKPKNAERLVDESMKLLGGIDVLIHAAAIFGKMPLGTVTDEEWSDIIDTNLKASFFLAQAAGIPMQTDGGSIVIISDVAARRPYAGYLPYCISKAGVDAMVRGLARALAPKVIVNAVAPYAVTRPEGLSDSGWNDIMNKVPLHRQTGADEIARLVKILCDKNSTITGQIIAIDGGRTLG